MKFGLSGLSSHVVLQSMMKPVFLLSLEVVCGNSALGVYSFCHVVCLAGGTARASGCLRARFCAGERCLG